MQKLIKTYQDLIVWQRSMDLAVECYNMTASFPKNELYGLVSQINRSGASIPANIAEGHGRGSRKEYVQFLWIAHGSLCELETHVLLSERVGLMEKGQTQRLLQSCIQIKKMLRALIGQLAKTPHP